MINKYNFFPSYFFFLFITFYLFGCELFSHGDLHPLTAAVALSYVNCHFMPGAVVLARLLFVGVIAFSFKLIIMR